MKKIKLIPDSPFHNYADVVVADFPDGEDRPWRKRCKVTVEFSEYDIEQLKQKGLDFEGAVEHYKAWLYNVVKANLAQDWECADGFDDVMKIIKDKISLYY